MSEKTTEAAPKQLLIEVNDQTDRDLDEIGKAEALNKSTAINRAVQWYAECTRVLNSGGQIYMRQPGSDEILAVRIE